MMLNCSLCPLSVHMASDLVKGLQFTWKKVSAQDVPGELFSNMHTKKMQSCIKINVYLIAFVEFVLSDINVEAKS